MKRFHRRCRRLCILAALLVLLVLFLRQNVLLDTASRHAILLDAKAGGYWRRNVLTSVLHRLP